MAFKDEEIREEIGEWESEIGDLPAREEDGVWRQENRLPSRGIGGEVTD
jgi:hypothetical protein